MDEVTDLRQEKTADLKAILEQMKLPKFGSKDELIKRIIKKRRHDEGGDTREAKAAKTGGITTDDVKEWVQMKIAELKPLVKEAGLPVTGTKAQLIIRLYTGEKHSKDEEADLVNEHFNNNQDLSDIFKQLSDEETGFKANSLRAVSMALKLWPEKINSAKDMKGVKGFGKGTMQKLQDHFDGVNLLASASDAPPPPEPEPSNQEEEKTENLKDSVIQTIQEDTSDDGLSVDKLKEIFHGKDITDVLQGLNDEGKIYNTIDDEHYKAS